MEAFGFSEAQASAIVEIRLRQLAQLERVKLQSEYDELAKFIAYCQEVLADEKLQMQVIKDETMELKSKYADARRSEILRTSMRMRTWSSPYPISDTSRGPLSPSSGPRGRAESE